METRIQIGLFESFADLCGTKNIGLMIEYGYETKNLGSGVPGGIGYVVKGIWI